MGNATSKNEIHNSIEQSIKIINDAVQDCSSVMTQSQLLSVSGSGNNISHVDFSQMMDANISCTQDASVQNDITAKISAKMEQSAKSVLGALSLNPGNAKADNIMSSFVKLGVAVQNTFNQKCQTQLNSTQTLDVTGSGNTISFIHFDQAAKIIRDCVTKSKAVNKIKTDIAVKAKQKASAEKKGLSLMMLFLLIVGVVLAFTFGGTGLLTSPAFIIGIIALIGGYLGLAFWQHWYPFPAKKEDKKEEKYYGRSLMHFSNTGAPDQLVIAPDLKVPKRNFNNYYHHDVASDIKVPSGPHLRNPDRL
jgi:multidrug efflux pump subunit AcrB